MASGYLRDYAYTNQFEFLAVVLEHFFETPTEFKQRFPELYGMVKRMINFREG
ncbi:zinc-dependent peptidase [Flavobacterium sp. J372]|uniref:zinc-dependent peptidase n=1 Tax=Flavobacterium sp. J372 TaxID=2898436 RepID=UPI0035B55E12